jgi:hypothetical protein
MLVHMPCGLLQGSGIHRHLNRMLCDWPRTWRWLQHLIGRFKFVELPVLRIKSLPVARCVMSVEGAHRSVLTVTKNLFPSGIDVLRMADFFSVGIRRNSFLIVAPGVAEYARLRIYLK